MWDIVAYPNTEHNNKLSFHAKRLDPKIDPQWMRGFFFFAFNETFRLKDRPLNPKGNSSARFSSGFVVVPHKY